jgi:integrase
MIYPTTAADNAPTDEEYEHLLMVAKRIQNPRKRTKAVFMLRAMGELGLRSGELLHFRPSWLDRERKIIQIPIQDDCRCRYCQEQAAAAAENDDITQAEALENYWQPKYRASHRAVPYNKSDKTVEITEQFADMVGNYDCAQSTINRRLNRLIECAGVNEDIHPHALRAYAALWWARQGLEAVYLQGLFGWNDMRVAVRYIQAGGDQLQQRINELTQANDISDGEHITDLTTGGLHNTDEVISQAQATSSPAEHPRSRDGSPSIEQPSTTETPSPDCSQASLQSYIDA